jgi:hypothetical protein
VGPLPVVLWLGFSYSLLCTALHIGLWSKTTKGRKVPGQNTWFQLQHLADLVSSPFLPSQTWGFIAVKPKLLLTFQDRKCFSIWQSGQQSAEGIPHSVSKETAPDLSERSLATPEQSHFLLQFHDPPTTIPDKPLYLPKCSWFCYVIWINQCKQTTSKASIFFLMGWFILGLELKLHNYSASTLQLDPLHQHPQFLSTFISFSLWKQSSIA